MKAVVKRSFPLKDLPEEGQQCLSKLDKNLLVNEQEEEFLNKLQQALEKDAVKDTFVISGWSDTGSRDRQNREYDFLFVSWTLKTFFHIEVKASFTMQGVEQLKAGKDFFLSNLPFPEKENWKYIQAMYYGNNDEKSKQHHPCDECQRYLLTQDTDLSNWWSQMVKELQRNASGGPSDHETYLNIFKYLLFQMFIQDDCITKGIYKHYYMPTCITKLLTAYGDKFRFQTIVVLTYPM